jgi:hypothetical protein
MILQPPPVVSTPSGVTISRGPYQSWPDSYRLGNGQCELVVVPAIGRIMRFAPRGGENVLWENRRSTRGEDWPNLGGDKVWPWPQDLWPRVLGGRDWPPPPECWRRPHAARVVEGGSVLRMISAPLPVFGVRIVREISLAADEMRATIVTRFERLHVIDDFDEDDDDPDGPPRPPCPWAIWSVTQVVPPQQLLIRLDSRASLPGGIRDLKPGRWKGMQREHGLLIFDLPPRTAEAKTGADGDAVAAVWPELIFTLKRLPFPPGAPFEPKTRSLPGEAVQVYSTGRTAPAYAELELTSPRWMHAPEMTVEWELQRISGYDDEAATDWMRAV